MSSSTVAERPNKVEITDAGPSRKKLRIEIPKETVAEQLSGHLDSLSIEAELPGFRKGHVPRRLLEKKFGTLVRKNAKEQMLASAFSKAVEDNKLKVIGTPTSQDMDKVEVDEGKPMVFEVEVEVLPEFTLPSLDGIAVKRPRVDVTDAMVDSELHKLCVTEGRLEERQETEPGDYLTGHARMIGPGGKVFFEQDGIVVQAPAKDRDGKGMIVGLVVDDLGAQLGLPKPGQKVTVKTTGPENHEVEDLRGQPVTVEYTPARIDRIIPATVDELIARFGFPDAASMKDAVRQRMQQRAAVEQQTAMRQQVARHLLEGTKMDLPERLTAQQAGRALERRRLELMYRGMDPAKVEEQVAQLRAASAMEAVRDLKLTFIIDRASESLGVRVSDMEVNGRIAQMAAERNERPEKLRQQLISSNQIQGVYMQIREHKTLDAIIAKAKLEEVSVEEYNKEIAEQSKAAREKSKSAKPAKTDDAGDKPAAAKPAPKKAKDDEDKPKSKKK